jgi:hypothetical protein
MPLTPVLAHAQSAVLATVVLKKPFRFAELLPPSQSTPKPNSILTLVTVTLLSTSVQVKPGEYPEAQAE